MMHLLPSVVLRRDNLLVQNPIAIAPWADHNAIHRSHSLA
jgi:hypothetical protein